jgi:hypothetical protein
LSFSDLAALTLTEQSTVQWYALTILMLHTYIHVSSVFALAELLLKPAVVLLTQQGGIQELLACSLTTYSQPPVLSMY